MRIEIPDWLWGSLVSFNAWRGQWLSWQLWLFGVHIFTFTVPPSNVLVGFGILNALFWLTGAINAFFDWASDRIDDLIRGLDYVRGILVPWLSDRIDDLIAWRDWLVSKSIELGQAIANLWLEADDVWRKITSGMDAWWGLRLPSFTTLITGIANAVSGALEDRMEPIRVWWNAYAAPVVNFLQNPWNWLFFPVISPLISDFIARFLPFQPVLDWFNIVKAEVMTLTADPGLWAYLQLERFIMRNAERVRKAVTTFLEVIW
ncbi:hypothetical protein LCGC14_2020130 [marine sediment metagenome]|uniref:Uncharacterized protein n=1 Tax=marine sediment metagenome TaxID=412755 RepID=A0A0F9HUW8_9ZZZZ